jgi:hypothetical protein
MWRLIYMGARKIRTCDQLVNYYGDTEESWPQFRLVEEQQKYQEPGHLSKN